ncbi:MAG: RsmB/NOP family class I SAM-dependent RNA methyltransferase [Clostridium sp.]
MDYRELPNDFLEKMKSLLGTSYMDYLDSFSEAPFHGLRINTLKTDAVSFAQISPWKLRPVRWIPNGFYYDEEAAPAKHPYYYAGLYYLQEPSAMTPASLLPIDPGDCVLDLCAAPGGKSTELAARLKGTGMLFSNDISSSRAKALLKNLELFGVENCCVAGDSPEKLSEYFKEFFDKILIDAPCSGEGMFRRDSNMVKSWLDKGPDYYSEIQRTITEEAVKMLKPGGMLIYSTCTFDPTENEGTIGYILDNHSDMSLVPLEKQEGFEPGIDLPECVRLFPHRISGEGHFIALLKKSQETAMEKRDTSKENLTSYLNINKGDMEIINDFLKLMDKTFDPNRMYMKNESIYYLPEPFLHTKQALLSKIRYLRTGLLLGELKNKRFEPSQALAMSLKKCEFSDTMDFSSEDERVLRYLKGETIALNADEIKNTKGWCLICTDGFPLGWAKRTGTGLKNKYYPGWRWQ